MSSSVICPQTHLPGLIVIKASNQSQMRGLLQNPDPSSQELPRLSEET